jgi:hypothetical protein
MLTKYTDVNSEISNIVQHYISDGYSINYKESKPTKQDLTDGCTYKQVLTRDVDGIECKAIIRLYETTEDNDTKNNTLLTIVDFVGDTKWSEETHWFTVDSKYQSKVNTNSKTYKCSTPSAYSNAVDCENEDDLAKLVRLIFSK